MSELGIAVLGGAFNPPHRSHRRLASAALQQLPVVEVRVLPAGDHPHKRSGDVADGEHRLSMCELAFSALPGVVVDDREVRRQGASFTVDTLAAMRQQAPARELWFLIGADNLPLLPTWRQHHRILELARIATFPRLGTPISPATLDALDLTAAERRSLLRHSLQIEPDAISASSIRRRLAAGERDLPELLPPVEAYILAQQLYET